MIRTICGATAALALSAVAGASQAQVVSSVSVTTSSAGPTSRLAFRDAQPCVSLTEAVRNIASVQVTVSASGAYIAKDTSSTDGGFAIYSSPFNPADLTQNCLASADSQSNWNLTAGTYTLVGGPWNVGPYGTYTLEFSGPGTVTAGPPPAEVPTLSEWAMILFVTVLAGGAAIYIQRRRLTA